MKTEILKIKEHMESESMSSDRTNILISSIAAIATEIKTDEILDEILEILGKENFDKFIELFFLGLRKMMKKVVQHNGEDWISQEELIETCDKMYRNIFENIKYYKEIENIFKEVSKEVSETRL